MDTMIGTMEELFVRCGRKPKPACPFKFGDRVMMIAASERNPIKYGIFVKCFKRTGKLNPGIICQISDGLGKFWESNIDNVAADKSAKCDICGDYHQPDNIPRNCETGDGE